MKLCSTSAFVSSHLDSDEDMKTDDRWCECVVGLRGYSIPIQVTILIPIVSFLFLRQYYYSCLSVFVFRIYCCINSIVSIDTISFYLVIPVGAAKNPLIRFFGLFGAGRGGTCSSSTDSIYRLSRPVIILPSISQILYIYIYYMYCILYLLFDKICYTQYILLF